MRIGGLTRPHISQEAVGILNPYQDPERPTQVLWVETDRVGGEDLDQYPDLRLIATPCTGTDHIDVAECERRGVEVLSVRGWSGLIGVRGTAEHTILLMLMALRRWFPSRNNAPGRTLDGKRVAIIGFGRVGAQVYTLVQSFGAEPVIDDPCRADIVSIHLGLSDQTDGWADAANIARWQPGTILVNTARGQLVRIPDVYDALESGQLAWYAADFPVSSQWHHPRMTITPHVAGWTAEGIEATQPHLARQIAARLAQW